MSLVRRVRWAASHISSKRASEEFGRVLTADSLPGDNWRVLDQRAWKTGKSGATEPWAMRARQANLITVWRSFEQTAASSWLWVQLTELVSEDDADEALRAVPDRFLRNTRADVEVISHRNVETTPVDRQRSAWALEQETMSPRGPGLALYLAFVIDSSLVALAVSGDEQSWTWDEHHTVASAQAALVRPLLDEELD